MGSSTPSPSPAPPQSTAPDRGASNASLRWGILRRALLARSSYSRASERTSNEQQKKGDTNEISRKASRGFNLIECHALPISLLSKSQENSLNGNENGVGCQKDVNICYKLPCGGSPEVNVVYRREDSLELNDIEASNRYNIDTTGLVCCWPSEEVLAFYCINHSDMFRCKRVLELGSGYGLAGLVIAASTNADEVVISDGNPQVVEYIQQNISMNAETFGRTKVKSMILHWDQEQASDMLNSFDIIVASDCDRKRDDTRTRDFSFRHLTGFHDVADILCTSPFSSSCRETKYLVSIFEILDIEFMKFFLRHWSYTIPCSSRILFFSTVILVLPQILQGYMSHHDAYPEKKNILNIV